MFAGQTGQVVKRAAVGADGYVLDHYNRAASSCTCARRATSCWAPPHAGAIESVFCDSLEVYDADWTADLLDEFRARRGYDLRPLLPLAELGSGERADAVRRDYGRTLTELFEERFLAPMHEWAAANRVRFRIQNYGAAAGVAGERAPCRHRRRRRLRVADALRRAMGIVGRAPLRQAGRLVGDVDVAPLARVSRDAARSEGAKPTSTSFRASTS